MSIKILSIRVEHLRGYADTSLPLNDFTVLVGENNEGKSSALKLLHEFVMKSEEDFCCGTRCLSEAEAQLWMPANTATHRARRLTLQIDVTDEPSRKKYSVSDMPVDLRLSITKSKLKARLNVGPPKKGEQHEDLAWQLLQEVREHVAVELIPAVRDATSSRFSSHLADVVGNKLTEKLRPKTQGGTSTEYRLSVDALKKLTKVVAKCTQSLDMDSAGLLNGMIQSAEVRLGATMDDILALIIKKLVLAISTGSHDNLMVKPIEVGNGLQSVIDIAMTIQNHHQLANKQLILITEEPEAFLHPSAQRDLIVDLRTLAERPHAHVIVTTHSPVVLDECRFEEIVLVKQQQFCPPRLENDAHRAAINTSLLSMPHAEVFFARGVLLVEGPGDKAFFSTLLRRLRRLHTATKLSTLVVQETGGKTAVAPWIHLLRSYRNGDKQFAIKWVSLFDGDAAMQDNGQGTILRLLQETSVQLTEAAKQDIIFFGNVDHGNANRRNLVKKANAALQEGHVILLQEDLEWAALSGDNTAALTAFRSLEAAPQDWTDPKECAKWLGSKVLDGNGASRKKAPHLRAKLAEMLPFDALSEEVLMVLKRACSLVMSPYDVRALLNKAKHENPKLI